MKMYFYNKKEERIQREGEKKKPMYQQPHKSNKLNA